LQEKKRVIETVCLGSLPPGFMVLWCWSSVFGRFKKEIGSEVWATVIAVVVFLYLLECQFVDFFWVFSVLLGYVIWAMSW
jgi:hypothetical protein